MLHTGVFEVGMDLILKYATENGSASAPCSSWITTLDDEVANYAMKLCAVVITLI